jgi:protein-S-isoprenylcysteine O-methyltransferase Ste14
MQIIGGLEFACWIAFVVVWLVSAFSAKRNLKNKYWWQSPWLRIVIFIVFYIFLWHRVVLLVGSTANILPPNILVAAIGLVLTAAGIAFAIWARFYIGRNWGMPMSLKADRELVDKGPYKYVRHPIYSGMLLAMAGTVLVAGPWWLVILAVSAIYFIYSANAEQKMLTQEFPEAYPAYKKRTKMLIPFVF